MKAAVLYTLGQPLVIEDGIDIPALKKGQVLVKMFYSGLCHSQLMEISGKRGADPYLPHMLGHEGTGEVVDVGEGVRKVKAGDRVILCWIKGDGLDGGGSTYNKGTRVINAGAITTFSEYTVVSENRCVVAPEGVPLDIGVLFGCAIPTGAGIMINTVQPKPGSSIAFVGLGGIGLSALLAVRLFNCATVIAVDVEDSKLELARQLGATHTINSRDCDPLAAIREITGGVGVDYSVEAAGLSQTIELAFNAVRKGGGRCVFASHPKAGEKIQLDPHDLISGKRIEGSWGGATHPDRDFPLYAKHYLAGNFPLQLFMGKRYSLDAINQALDDLENRRVIRAIIDIAVPKS